MVRMDADLPKLPQTSCSTAEPSSNAGNANRCVTYSVSWPIAGPIIGFPYTLSASRTSAPTSWLEGGHSSSISSGTSSRGFDAGSAAPSTSFLSVRSTTTSSWCPRNEERCDVSAGVFPTGSAVHSFKDRSGKLGSESLLRCAGPKTRTAISRDRDNGARG